MLSNIVIFLAVSQFYVIALTEESECDDLTKHKNYHLMPHGKECHPQPASPRIMGGHDVQLGEFPWLAVLFLNLSSIDLLLKWCGGSVISSKYVITAAHCIPDDITQLYEIVVRVGEHDLRTAIDCDNSNCAPEPVTFQVDKMIPHPRYETTTNTNDLGLIRVKGEIHWSDFVYPACLPTPCALVKKNFQGESLVVSGFGALIDSPETLDASLLQKVVLTGSPQDSCARSYNNSVTRTQICAGGSDVGELNKDACHGDSGGPLMYYSRQGGVVSRPYLVGLVSAGENCAWNRTSQAPGIYTRVAFFLPWILDTISE